MRSEPRPVSQLVCAGCGFEAPDTEPYPFRCPRAGPSPEDDVDHVLARVLDVPRADPGAGAFAGAESNPFHAFRAYFHAYHQARRHGMDDRSYRTIVETLDAAVHGVDARRFRATPFPDAADLARRIGFGSLRVKNETGNVAGSHKARHLMGVMIWLEVQARLGHAGPERPLAVASCGNAALAAAVVARAAGRRLDVYVPPHADSGIVARLERLGAHLHVCPRRGGERGDPCYLRFREAIEAGALPFTCQGNENGLVLDGGETVALEIVREAVRAGVEIDRLFVQVGGGALASACARGFEEARRAGVVSRLPRLHAVQTEGAFPLVRAYDRVVARIEELVRSEESGVVFPEDPGARAVFIREQVERAHVEAALRHAATHRSAYMQPWDREPRSIATGILDDETYDWLAVVRGMLVSGGHPVIASETVLEEANRLAVETTGIAVDPTGTAGLAAALALRRDGAFAPDETVAVLFTGARREAE